MAISAMCRGPADVGPGKKEVIPLSKLNKKPFLR